MKIDIEEIERLGGRERNPDIDSALRILELNGLITPLEGHLSPLGTSGPTE